MFPVSSQHTAKIKANKLTMPQKLPKSIIHYFLHSIHAAKIKETRLTSTPKFLIDLLLLILHCLQEELRASHSVREKEVNKQRNLDRVRIRDPANRKRIVSSSKELLSAHRSIGYSMLAWIRG